MEAFIALDHEMISMDADKLHSPSLTELLTKAGVSSEV